VINTTQKDDSVKEIIYILAIAARFEREGQYNIAKILRASVDAITRRVAFNLNLTMDRSKLIEELDQIKEILTNHGVNPDFGAALKRGKNAMIKGNLPLIGEIPHPYVCRRCGQSYLRKPITNCLTCGSWPSSFQQFSPVYWLSEFDPLTLLEHLRKTPKEVKKLLEGLDEDIFTKLPTNGGWSIRQVVTHLRDAQGVLSTRLKLILEQDNPILTSQAVFDWATREDGKPASTNDIFDMYWSARKKSLDILETIPLKDWWRTGEHEEFGKLTLTQQVSYFAAHEITHLRQLNNLRPS